jgi:hypothetical protein
LNKQTFLSKLMHLEYNRIVKLLLCVPRKEKKRERI